MADISQVNFPDDANNPYDIADTTARSGLADKMDKVNPTGSGKMLFNAASTSTGGSNSVCLSYGSDAKNNYSSCLGGRGLVTGRSYQTVLGYYNDEDTSSAVVVGWGSSTTRKNIFTLSTAGAGDFASTIEATGLGATLKQAVIDAIYPVGSIYMTVSDNTVAKVQARFGGTWVAWGSGRVPVGVKTSDEDFATVEKTGGKSEVTLTAAESGVQSHTHTITNTTSSPSGTHTHGDYVIRTSAEASGYGLTATSGFKNRVLVHSESSSRPPANNGIATTDNSGAHSHTINSTSKNASAAHTNLQPYITCYMWKRTA